MDLNGTEVKSGYAKIWYNNPPELRTLADKLVYGVVTVTAVTAEIVMIGLYAFFHHKIRAYINSKEQAYYYLFWAAQILVVVFLIIVLPAYLSSVQHNIAIAPYIYLMTMTIDFSAAFIFSLVFYVQNGMKDFLPVPFSSWLCCKDHSCERFQFCNNCVSKTLICCIHQVLCRCCKLKDEDMRTDAKPQLDTLESGDDYVTDYDASAPLVDSQPKISWWRKSTRCHKRFSAKELRNCSCLYLYRWFLNLLGLTVTLFFISYVVQSLPNVLIAYYAYPSRTVLRLSFIQLALLGLLITIASLIYLLEKIGWLCYAHNRKRAPPDTKDYESIAGISVDIISNYTDEFMFSIRKSVCQIVILVFTLIALLVVLVLIGTIVFKQTTDDDDILKTILIVLPTLFGNAIICKIKQAIFISK